MSGTPLSRATAHELAVGVDMWLLWKEQFRQKAHMSEAEGFNDQSR